MVNRRQDFRRLTPALVLAIALCSPAGGATFDVTKTADTVDGSCDDDCSLREAIIAANDNPGHDTVSIPAGNYILVLVGPEQNDTLSDDIDVFDDTTIVGAGVGQTIVDGNNTFRIFDVFNNTGAEAVTTIRDMTIANAEFSNCGGGVAARAGTVNLTQVKLLNNRADRGGGLCSIGAIINVTDSTFEGNSVDRWGGGMTILPTEPEDSQVLRTTFINNEAGLEDGGAIEFCGCAGGSGDSLLTVTNSTFVGNIGRDGGAVWTDLAVAIINSTLADNASTASSAAISNDGGKITFENTILDNRGGFDCDTSSGVLSAGHNTESATSCGFAKNSDQQNADPMLEELADNGGQTLTMALLKDSPAIDAGGNANCPDIDQRGVLRPIDGDEDGTAVCDIGAYEFDVVRNLGINALPVILDYLLDDDSEGG